MSLQIRLWYDIISENDQIWMKYIFGNCSSDIIKCTFVFLSLCVATVVKLGWIFKKGGHAVELFVATFVNVSTERTAGWKNCRKKYQQIGKMRSACREKKNQQFHSNRRYIFFQFEDTMYCMKQTHIPASVDYVLYALIFVVADKLGTGEPDLLWYTWWTQILIVPALPQAKKPNQHTNIILVMWFWFDYLI